MEVEIYDTLANEVETAEHAAESLELIEQLGLTGQLRLVGDRQLDDGDSVSLRKPFGQMSAAEIRVYQTLFPTSLNVEDFDREPIPYRVLAAVALCREHDWYPKGMKVWCPASLADKDPVLVGQLDGYGQYDLIARWGPALESFETLEKKARKLWRADREGDLKGKLASLDADVQKYFTGGWVS